MLAIYREARMDYFLSENHPSGTVVADHSAALPAYMCRRSMELCSRPCRAHYEHRICCILTAYGRIRVFWVYMPVSGMHMICIFGVSDEHGLYGNSQTYHYISDMRPPHATAVRVASIYKHIQHKVFLLLRVNITRTMIVYYGGRYRIRSTHKE